MAEPHHDLVDIIGHRVTTEARLTALLERAESSATVEDIQQLIFNESLERFSAYLL